MRLLLLPLLVSLLITFTYCSDENCVEESSNSCSKVSEYNAYITCISENRRSKRSTGCNLHQESCEYTDCEKCQEDCDPSCDECECPDQCRNCCSQTCATNLCCHKTCHNQCKTNYCRNECKKECKQRINEESYTGGSSSNKQDLQINEQRTDTKQSKHNITTIINLHNIINNTNHIDIPIKINNTNYNNITLRRNDVNDFSHSMDYDSEMSGNNYQPPQQEENNGERCCYVVGPRQCVKTNVYPFTRCYHYRHRKCAPYCIATIVHAQPQHFCDDQGCRNKVFYVPQTQPRCGYQPSWPFVNCGPQTFHNCHGCYDHQVNDQHHLRCSRCYDNGFGNGPLYRQGPYYQPSSFYGGAPMFGGYQTYPQQMPMPMPMPMYQPYPNYPMYPPMGYPNMGFQGIAQNDEIIDENQNSEVLTKSGDSTANNVNAMLQYPATNYVHETIITPDQFNPNISLMNDQSKQISQNKEYNTTATKTQTSRYALISISPENAKQEKKEKRIKRKKDKLDHHHVAKNEETTEQMLKDAANSAEISVVSSTESI